MNAGKRKRNSRLRIGEFGTTYPRSAGTPPRFKIGKNESTLSDYFGQCAPIIDFTDGSLLLHETLYELPKKTCLTILTILERSRSGIGAEWIYRLSHRGLSDDKTRSRRIRSRVSRRKSRTGASLLTMMALGKLPTLSASGSREITASVLLVHCKFSAQPTAGSRFKDVQEVCAQAQKSTRFMDKPKKLLTKLIKRHDERLKKTGQSRLEVGNRAELRQLEKQYQRYRWEFEVWAVSQVSMPVV